MPVSVVLVAVVAVVSVPVVELAVDDVFEVTELTVVLVVVSVLVVSVPVELMVVELTVVELTVVELTVVELVCVLLVTEVVEVVDGKIRTPVEVTTRRCSQVGVARSVTNAKIWNDSPTPRCSAAASNVWVNSPRALGVAKLRAMLFSPATLSEPSTACSMTTTSEPQAPPVTS